MRTAKRPAHDVFVHFAILPGNALGIFTRTGAELSAER
jgi:hypothetical protein